MFEENKIKHQLILEVLSSHEFILPTKIQKAAKEILELNLTDKDFTRFLIHTYQNSFIGKNSHKYNKILKECIKHCDYKSLVDTLKSLELTWPELSDPKNKITSDEMDAILSYYKFQNEFIHTVFSKVDQILEKMDFFIYDINPFFHVKYEINKKLANKKVSYYEKCFVRYQNNGGKIPLITLH